MRVTQFARDTCTVDITSADIWEGIRLLNANSISVFHVQQKDQLTFSVEINRKDYQTLKRLLTKKGDLVKLRRTAGPHTVLRKAFSRPVLLVGLTLLFAAGLYLPTRILFVQVEGNQLIPSRKILEAAQAAGIGFGASRAEVRSEKMKNSLLSSIPELQWAGINTYGCKAVISVKERTPSDKNALPEQAVSSVVAARDGIIQSVTGLNGTILCKEGQAVKKGQVLISGFTDCGIAIQASRAKGEIYAQTLRSQQAVIPQSYRQREDAPREKKYFSLIVGKKRINLWKDSGIWDSSCGRISREYPLTLPGGFRLPISLSCETVLEYASTEQAMQEQEASDILSEFTKKYISEHMIAGVITGVKESIQHPEGYYLLSGSYVCSEMIGRERMEIGAQYEQTGGADRERGSS